ncbi:MAG TPA: PRC-barrel domain-containing protein [Anaeromyxobacteraceae bacterium]|nr:PRC-barrel domain-containing protein [Anaeromyxobacteraceae bacterium]
MKIRVAVALFGAVALTSAAYAQQGGQPKTPPVAGRVVLGVTVEETQVVALGYRASKVIGATVYNDKAQKIGKVKDLIIKTDGTLSYAILDVGGFLGVGAHHVAIPVSQFTSVKPKIILPGATKEALEQLPEFYLE